MSRQDEKHDQTARAGHDDSEDDPFYRYYAEESVSEITLHRFEQIRAAVMRVLAGQERGSSTLDVVDIGCGAGTQSIMWAKGGHRLHGVDINRKLVELAQRRSREAHLDIDFQVGSATELPWAENTMDVCLVPELLEHVVEWGGCLDEFARVLKPHGVLFLSTNNVLCPVQQEFDLPLYSWYPAFMKRHYERLAVTTRPELVNHAEYPAVNWFSFYSLRKALAERGFRSMDRFDVMDPRQKSRPQAIAISAVQNVPPLRWLAHVLTPYTQVLAVKTAG